MSKRTEIEFILNGIGGIARAMREAMEMGHPSKDSAPELFSMVSSVPQKIERLKEAIEEAIKEKEK